MNFVKICGSNWLSDVKITDSECHKSFGPITIDDLFTALENFFHGRVETDLEKWISENRFLKNSVLYEVFRTEIPWYEVDDFEPTTAGVVKSIICEYNPKAKDFFANNETFYIWVNYHPNNK